MRTIIRFSINGEGNGALRNSLHGILVNDGLFTLTGTATYERLDATPNELSVLMEAFWEAIGNHQGQGAVDHFWMYSDSPNVLIGA
jgi:hypothetical protein